MPSGRRWVAHTNTNTKHPPANQGRYMVFGKAFLRSPWCVAGSGFQVTVNIRLLSASTAVPAMFAWAQALVVLLLS